jgi:D-alanyl-D-alanine dipeptidase
LKQFNLRVFFVFMTLFGALLPDTAGAAQSAVHSSPASKEAFTLSEAQLAGMGFVDVQTLDPDIKVELKYASNDNFMRSAVYGEFKKAWLKNEAAVKLALANKYLKEIDPDLTLLVGDALRPRAVSRQMWSFLSGSPMQRYVANPKGGSMHNYGCAVDITICDISGKRLDMGTPLDYFGPLAQPRYEGRFLKQGKLTEEQVANRKLLRKVMAAAGFHGIQLEWWHFEAFDKKTIRKTYSLVE